MYLLFSLVFSAANVAVSVIIVWLASWSRRWAGGDRERGAAGFKCESVPLFVRVLVLDILGTIFRAPTLLISRTLSALALCGVPCLWYWYNILLSERNLHYYTKTI